MDELAPHLQPSDPIMDSEEDELIDKSLHATLSLYIPAEKLGGLFKNWTRQKRLELRDNYEHTKNLREAIDPLFNDIAIRDTNSTIDEFLIDVEGTHEIEEIVITLPQRLRWETEGKHFVVNLGAQVSHELKCRMFWYAYTDGALSYHISFFMNYAHKFEDYYFLSMFQKLMFPKEFYIPKSADRSQLTPDDIASGNTGLWPLDYKLVSAIDYSDPSLETREQTFWQYVQKRFAHHLLGLIKSANLEFRADLPIQVHLWTEGDLSKEADEHARALWNRLIDQTDFIEVPYLKAPAARALFLIQDRDFFKLLQDENRSAIRCNPNYQVHMPDGWENLDNVEITQKDFYRTPATGEFDIRYFFLSGFFQNIIDFLNQDLPEIRDGTDPIYPLTKEQQEEAYYVRLANGRAIYQVVERSRSLEVGNEFIGTCPYIFLVHLMALHNEFLVRTYELETTEVQDKLSDPGLTKYGDLQALLNRRAGQLSKTSELQKVTQLFYAFRYKAFAVYKKHLYLNTLRYDTERDVFEKLQQIRSTEPRLRRCDDIAAGLDRTIQDIEEDRRYQEQQRRAESDRILNFAVFGVALFSAFQVLYVIADKIGELKTLIEHTHIKISDGIPVVFTDKDCKCDTDSIEAYTLLDLLSLTIFAASFFILIALLVRRLMRDADRQRR